jgi:hypothetical protein
VGSEGDCCACYDSPDRWSSLLDDVKRLLGSGDVREVGVGIVAALECVRASRYVFYCVILGYLPYRSNQRVDSTRKPTFYQTFKLLPPFSLPSSLSLMACSIPSHPDLRPRRSQPYCTLFLRRTKLQLLSTFPHTSRAHNHSFLQEDPCSTLWGWLSPWKVFQLTRKIGRNVNGGRPRSGRMEFSVSCSIGVYLLYTLYVFLIARYIWTSLSASVANADRVWCICRALCDCLRFRNIQGVPPPSRTIYFRAGMVVQEMPIIDVTDLPFFH